MGKGRRLTGVRKQMQWVAPTELPWVGDEENVRPPQPEKMAPERWYPKAGAGKRSRTSDLLITNQLLYQLSYSGAKARNLSRAAREVNYGQAPKHFTRLWPSAVVAVTRYPAPELTVATW